MKMLFLDESGNYSTRTASREQSDFFVLGGVIIDEKEYQNCVVQYNIFKSNLPEKVRDLRLHAAEIRHAHRPNQEKNHWRGLVSEAEGLETLSKAYKELLLNLPAQYYAVIIDNIELKKKYRSPDYQYTLAYQFLLERFDKLCRGGNQHEFGYVNLAGSSNYVSRKIIETHESLLTGGTSGFSPLGGTFENKFKRILPTINIADFRSSIFFEIADLVCYAFNRAYYAYLVSHIANFYNANDDFLSIINTKIPDLSPLNHCYLGDVAVKVFPYKRKYDG